MAEPPIYGALELVRAGDADAVILPAVRDAAGRYVAVDDGDGLDVLDLHDPSFCSVARYEGIIDGRLSPDGQRIAILRANGLELRSPKKTLVAVETPPLAPVDFGVTADGGHVWIAGHDESAAARIQLYDDRLRLVDTVDDLRSYSPYLRSQDEKHVPFGEWSECMFLPQPNAPAWTCVIVNTGDTCAAVIAFRAEGDRLVVEQEALQRAVFDIDSHYWRHLHLLPQGELLALSRDSLFSVLAWPPTSAAPRVKNKDPASRLRIDHAIVLPFSDEEYLDIAGLVTSTREHVLVGVEADNRTVALIAADPTTLQFRGVVEVPENDDLTDLGNDVFTDGASLWRLRRTT